MKKSYHSRAVPTRAPATTRLSRVPLVAAIPPSRSVVPSMGLGLLSAAFGRGWPRPFDGEGVAERRELALHLLRDGDAVAPVARLGPFLRLPRQQHLVE